MMLLQQAFRNRLEFDNRLADVHDGVPGEKGGFMLEILRHLRDDEQGQDIAEYAVMLAVILLLVVGTIKLIGTNANSTFSNVASSLQ